MVKGCKKINLLVPLSTVETIEMLDGFARRAAEEAPRGIIKRGKARGFKSAATAKCVELASEQVLAGLEREGIAFLLE